MPIRNQNWYNLQSTRRYPLDDKSTGVDDAGSFIRDDIVVDCHIRFPASFGQYAYVQGINVTANLVTIVFGAADDLSGTNSRTIAVVSASKPTATNVNIELTPVRYGVSGWIVFGSGINTNFVGRYTTPIQTLIGARNARAYTNLPVPTIGKIGRSTALEGVVGLLATTPIVATYYENYTVPVYDPITDTTTTTPIKAIVFAGEAPTATTNPYTTFLGPCSARPESGNCPKTPIERIGGIEPDCETGNINITVNGGLSAAMFSECGGLDITTERGLAEACTPEIIKPPPTDQCPCPAENTEDNFCWPEMPGEGSLVGPCESEELTECDDGYVMPMRAAPEQSVDAPQNEIPTLPVLTFFSPDIDDVMEDRLGNFGLDKTMTPPIKERNELTDYAENYTKVSQSAESLNLSVLRVAASDWAYDRAVSTEIKIANVGANKNGGIVLNYSRALENNVYRTKYVTVLLDQDTNELQIKRFDGHRLIKESSIPVVTSSGTWYRIEGCAVWSGGENDGHTLIQAHLYDVNADNLIASLTTTVQNYELINGRPGIIADKSITYFNCFRVT